VHLAAEWPAHALGSGPASQTAGRWQIDAAVDGRIRPLALEAEASLRGRNIAVGKQRVERVQIPVAARLDAWRVEATSSPFALLGGQWQWTGRYEFAQRATVVHVMAADLSLSDVASLAGLPLTSQGQARGQIQVRMPGLEIQEAVAVGSWSARDVNIPPLQAREAQGVLRIADGEVRLADIEFQQEGGWARADLRFRLDEPQVVGVELEARDWPLQPGTRPVVLRVDGQAKLQTDILQKTAEGEAHLTGRVLWQGKDLARVRLAAGLQGQTLELRQLQAETLGGSAEGTARIPLNRWTDSVAHLRWQGMQLQQLETWLPPLQRAAGTLSGTLVVEQTGGGAEAPTQVGRTRSLGPLRFILEAKVARGRFGPAQMEAARLVGYLDPRRLLLEQADFDVLGGRLATRARLSPRAGGWYGSLVADFNDLSLGQLVHAVDPNAGTHVGRLSGNATLLPAFDHGLMLAGEGRIRVTQSDLIDNGVVRTLYNTLSLRFGEQEPTGTGELRLSFEGPAVVFSSVEYFNRGVEIRGAGTIRNVNQGAASPIEGYAVASTRVLRGVKLPGLGALDRLLSAFQTGAASVKIGGTLDDTQVQVVPLPEVLGPFRRLLWAQLRE